jgi:hypothetical protein
MSFLKLQRVRVLVGVGVGKVVGKLRGIVLQSMSLSFSLCFFSQPGGEADR